MLGHKGLKVFQMSYQLAMEIFQLSKSFPSEEKYSLTDQIRRSSRSVAANIAEGYRKRQYSKVFCNKMSDSDGEATETQVWLEFPEIANTFPVKIVNILLKDMKKSAECWVE